MDNKLATCINIQPSRLLERDGGHDFTISSLVLKSFADCKCAPENIKIKVDDSKGKNLLTSPINIIPRLDRVANTRFRFEGERSLASFSPPFAVAVNCEKGKTAKK